ncbi:hypothetical protein LCGC14_1201970 [marine sediment metagenome]|uniref:Presenilin n=1 Tax=marine sediment metagenome TaxID=412755 RepID=A0A0F9LGL6_9ZZZZ
MVENKENIEEKDRDLKLIEIGSKTNETGAKVVEKDFIPHFFPTYRIKRNLYPIPISLVVIISGILAYLTYVEVGVQIDGGYFSETEYGAIGGILNGLIYTAIAVLSGFIIVFIIKKKGINFLMYIFGIGFGMVGFLQTWFFGEIILYWLFQNNFQLYYLFDVELIFFTAVFTIVMIYKYFTSRSIKVKNFIVLYIGLLIGASMGVLMPLWTTLAILIGISLWDLFAVLYKHGPIKQMIDLVSEPKEDHNKLSDKELKEKIQSGEYAYDTSKLEIGIGDLAFYSMLTSNTLVQTGNIIIMILTSLAIMIGTGITIMGLKRNKILPGLPISIFLGIGTMLLSWYLFSLPF